MAVSLWVGWILLLSASTTAGSVYAFEKATPLSIHSTAISTPSQCTTEGELTSIDLNRKELEILAVDGTRWKIQTNAKTKTIDASGQLIDLKKLKIGERVKVRHRDQTQYQVAKTIEAL